ncbi:hypothetical protein DICSQDRAFT_169461 [Dichomitus squalens LYAD-421 SS1]|uniref:Uncharacterized protein n=1 Tax=Dichomitus squalens (strain LYAD-421) TaxID=732165 RepID=R7T202_DICSQ|nr:uncharacterized protein DICSQDRAFT_169461 [Dichomitus squalens LYAD-421 SS1]EJF62421.1 hypothetical protein DICSQDRAFT_169461 [Dichomitus squalens LYAD-421 SS1]
MPRSYSSYASPPPPYKSPPYTSRTISSTSQYPQSTTQGTATYDSCSTSGPSMRPGAPSETSSLWSTSTYRSKRSRKVPVLVWVLLAFLLVVVMGQNTGYMSTLVDDVSLAQKAANRVKWRAERERWEVEKARHQYEVDRERETRQHEREEHERDKEQWERDQREGREALENDKAEWHRQQQEEHETLEREKEGWARQQREEREAFDREKEGWARERWEEEKHRKDVEWRRRGAFWSEPWAATWQCSGYGTRPYAAHLWDLPGDVDWHEACMDMPIKINGQWMDGPANCQRDKRHIWGTWYVNFGEPQCVPYWDPIRYMGCSPGRSGMRRYEARLMNLRHGDDWDLMCRTTPADISGIHFDHPDSCEDKNGRTGVWDVPDGWC